MLKVDLHQITASTSLCSFWRSRKLRVPPRTEMAEITAYTVFSQCLECVSWWEFLKASWLLAVVYEATGVQNSQMRIIFSGTLLSAQVQTVYGYGAHGHNYTWNASIDLGVHLKGPSVVHFCTLQNDKIGSLLRKLFEIFETLYGDSLN